MGGGNAQKSATARARKLEKEAKANKGSQLKANAASLTVMCQICKQQFMCTVSDAMLKQHSENKHPKNTFAECYPGRG